MISCYIISDTSTVEMISGFAKSLSLTIHGSASNLKDCINEIVLRRPDLVYLDISYLQGNDVEFSIIKQFCSVVILSDHIDGAYAAFECHAFDYILKPINYLRFINGVERFKKLRENFSEKLSGSQIMPDEFFFIKTDKKGLKEVMVRYIDLIFLEAMQNYIRLQLEGGRNYICHVTMKDMEHYLPARLFSRVHKSFIINDNKITSIEGYMVYLNETHKIQIGSTHHKAFFEKINRRKIYGQRRIPL